MWSLFLVIVGAGIAGGVVNALISDNRDILPKREEKTDTSILRPGILGNMLVGGFAAFISWGLYGPAAALYIVGGPKPEVESLAPEPGITLAALAGAVLVGIAGARWITNEVDKLLLRAAASEAASREADDKLSAKLAVATPAEALRLARK
ncbi:MAG: hypothetical protein ACYTBZ_30335 [Planctomycetota bacterium]|jgi:hypothetical protein